MTTLAISLEFDSLGRVTTETNRLGAFDYHYIAQTPRLDRIDLPHGHTTHFVYDTATNDHRLTRIEHRLANSGILAAHDYGHDPHGTITRWSQERSGLPNKSWHYGYDPAMRLTSATLKDPAETILATHRWQYDPGDNRIAQWSADLQSAPMESVPSKYNSLNQLLTQGIGPTRIAGAIDEPGTVTINGVDAKMRNQTEFETWLDLPPGSHQIDIAATDSKENTATQSYEITIADTPVESFQYDLNGNLAERTGPNGTTTYHWDAFDRLIAIHHPDGTSSHFTYDGLSRRVAITEKDDEENITQHRNFLWHGLAIVEERSGTTGATVEKRFYPNGVELVSGSNAGTYTYRTDHLGSICEIIDSTGTLTARYDYDTWGVPELVFGTFDLDFRYTGHFYHTPSALHLAPFRAYDAKLGRWISRDPIAEEGGINLYAYVLNNPLNNFDSSGLTPEGAWNGFKSFVQGNAWNVYHGARTVGLLGARDYDWAGTENIMVQNALERYRTDECFRKAANQGLIEFGKYLANNKADFVTTRMATGAALTKAIGPKGLVLGAGAINGDFRHYVELATNQVRATGREEILIAADGLTANDLASAYGAGLLGLKTAEEKFEQLKKALDTANPSGSKDGCK